MPPGIFLLIPGASFSLPYGRAPFFWIGSPNYPDGKHVSFVCHPFLHKFILATSLSPGTALHLICISLHRTASHLHSIASHSTALHDIAFHRTIS